jgi:hypothetical protein
VARGKSRAFDEKSSPLASSPLPLARKLAIAAEAFMNTTDDVLHNLVIQEISKDLYFFDNHLFTD